MSKKPHKKKVGNRAASKPATRTPRSPGEPRGQQQNVAGVPAAFARRSPQPAHTAEVAMLTRLPTKATTADVTRQATGADRSRDTLTVSGISVARRT
ncbi:hypothetical protein JOF29_000073 [Kribbella aluminosa]|uniref:Uncharacterized protein n=1 Tax=Kribbella aluminosa TaxID=416017 RepID=A0ABS4UBL5_9ACTN|nr:hypothetical protein [Kribbella aluminosa]MBP2348990.1 hypothetical protein [Kribbella aluminosa]